MTGDQIARALYLGILGLAIAGSVLVSGRENLNRTVQQAMIWLFIFLGVIGAYGLWGDISRDVAGGQAQRADGRISVPLARDGHYYLTLQVNGVDVAFVIDTGASSVVLTQSDARALGFDPIALDYNGVAMTANGSVSTATITLDRVSLGDQTDLAVPAFVNGGTMDQSLLGMSYLNRFAHIEISNNYMVLTR
ncbi:aspartyl protease family protein [Yoonia tamlensis]|uniref:Aspartyl protease family protein n=1 Tax=Yoonia tamlensis TaxID=390270 RepID=A0A1I6GFE5_9RHOB|nr:TIGR02281 family clan AA aspartic protease [Yoonia tamlensis]SFR40841.1 aspartyl protease family protein [Yoonia tamlensis]